MGIFYFSSISSRSSETVCKQWDMVGVCCSVSWSAMQSDENACKLVGYPAYRMYACNRRPNRLSVKISQSHTCGIAKFSPGVERDPCAKIVENSDIVHGRLRYHNL